MAKPKVTIGVLRPQRRGAAPPPEAPASRTHVRERTRSPAPSPARAPTRPPTPLKEGVGVRGHEGGEKIESKKPDVADLLTSASKLSAADRKELLARLSLAESLGGQERDVDMWSGAVHEALVRVAGRDNGAAQGPMVVKRLLGATNAWAPVSAFMAASKLDKLTVTERQSVYGLLAKLLVRHAAEIADRSGAPFSAKLVSNCTGNMRSVFDHAFPGYVASGLAHIVARRLTSPRIKAD